MINTLYLPELREMLTEGNVAELREFCTALHPARTAEFMEGLTTDESWQVMKHAPPWLRGQIFAFLDEEKKVQILKTGNFFENNTCNESHTTSLNIDINTKSSSAFNYQRKVYPLLCLELFFLGIV